MYLKRSRVPKHWPVLRKGTKYVASPLSDLGRGIPVLIALRDALKIAQTRKEAKKMINSKNILLNGKPIKEERHSILLLDVLTLVPMKKSYKLGLSENGKFIMEEIKETEANKKVAKIIDKKILKGKKIQLNLSDGRNFLSDVKCNVGDSALVNFKEKKIEKCLPLNEKANVLVFAGKHSGKKGKIEKIYQEKKIAELNFGEKKINVLIKQMMAIE